MNKEEIKELIEKSEMYHYVYIMKKPNGVPFYIGKGCNLRVLDHEFEAVKTKQNSHKLNTIRKVLNEGGEINYEIVKFFDEEQDAFDLEVELISEIGRSDLGTGPLTNLDAGGCGGTGSWSEDTMRKKLCSCRIRYENDPTYKQTLSKAAKLVYIERPEVKEKISNTLKHTYETTDLSSRLSETHKKRNEDPEVRKLNSEALKKSHQENPEIRLKQSKSREKYFKDPNFRKKLSESRKKFNRENPELYKEYQEKAIEAAKTPEARSKNSQSKREWVLNNPDKEKNRIAKIKETTSSVEFSEAASKRAKESHNTPEAKENISNAQKKRFSDPQQRELARQKALDAGKRSKHIKHSIITKCKTIIKQHNLTNIKLPDGRSSIKTFNEFEQKLIIQVKGA